MGDEEERPAPSDSGVAQATGTGPGRRRVKSVSHTEPAESLRARILAAWRTRESVEPEGGSLKPWLLGIATRKVHNANRGLRRRLAFLARSPEPRPVGVVSAGEIFDAPDSLRRRSGGRPAWRYVVSEVPAIVMMSLVWLSCVCRLRPDAGFETSVIGFWTEAVSALYRCSRH